jgi:hypothetical protein
MPEIHPFKRLRSWTLQSAFEQGQLLVVTCNLCRVTHRYLPTDIIELTGDATLDRVLSRFKCERCNKKNYMELTLHFPHGSEYGRLDVRRLRAVRTMRLPVWLDEKL